MTTHKVRLAYVVNSLNPGGTEKLVAEMAQAFAAQYELLVVCLDEPGTWATLLRQRGIAVHCLWRQGGLDLSMPLRLAALFRANQVQLIHAHQCTPWFYAALSRLVYRAPRLLLEEHGRFYPEVRNRAREWVNRLLINPLTHAFVAVSQDIRQRLQSYEAVPLGRTMVIYNGVTPPALLTAQQRDELRRSLGFAPDHIVVGTVGRFDPIKNLPMLVQSLANVRQGHPQLRGLLVGAGPVLEEVQTLLRAAGLETDVVLTGFRQDARLLTQCMDVFVLASFSEGTSVALLEAMAAGVPVAVTRVGGNPEIVIEGESGWMVPSGDVAALSAVLQSAVSDVQLRNRFGVAAQRRFAEQFGFDAMLANYRKLYVRLVVT